MKYPKIIGTFFKKAHNEDTSIKIANALSPKTSPDTLTLGVSLFHILTSQHIHEQEKRQQIMLALQETFPIPDYHRYLWYKKALVQHLTQDLSSIGNIFSQTIGDTSTNQFFHLIQEKQHTYKKYTQPFKQDQIYRGHQQEAKNILDLYQKTKRYTQIAKQQKHSQADQDERCTLFSEILTLSGNKKHIILKRHDETYEDAEAKNQQEVNEKDLNTFTPHGEKTHQDALDIINNIHLTHLSTSQAPYTHFLQHLLQQKGLKGKEYEMLDNPQKGMIERVYDIKNDHFKRVNIDLNNELMKNLLKVQYSPNHHTTFINVHGSIVAGMYISLTNQEITTTDIPHGKMITLGVNEDGERTDNHFEILPIEYRHHWKELLSYIGIEAPAHIDLAWCEATLKNHLAACDNKKKSFKRAVEINTYARTIAQGSWATYIFKLLNPH